MFENRKDVEVYYYTEEGGRYIQHQTSVKALNAYFKKSHNKLFYNGNGILKRGVKDTLENILSLYENMINIEVSFFGNETDGLTGVLLGYYQQNGCGQWVEFLDAADYMDKHFRCLVDHYEWGCVKC